MQKEPYGALNDFTFEKIYFLDWFLELVHSLLIL